MKAEYTHTFSKAKLNKIYSVLRNYERILEFSENFMDEDATELREELQEALELVTHWEKP